MGMRLTGKECGCQGRFGGKAGGRSQHGFNNKMHAEANRRKRYITVDRAVGVGDMGPGRQPLLGNTSSGLANGQRDIVDHGNAQDAMQKRKIGSNPIESKKKNKAQ